MRIVETIVGKEVLDADANYMGIVSDLELDVETKELLSVILKKKGISRSLKTSNSEDVVPFDLVKTIGDKIILKDEYDI